MLKIDTVHTTIIEINYGGLSGVLDWCQQNMKYNWSYDILLLAGNDAGHYSFSFEDETDYINFILWEK